MRDDDTPGRILAESCLTVLIGIVLIVALLTLAVSVAPLDELTEQQRIETMR